MSSEADQFTLEELQEIKDWIEQYGVDLTWFKTGELSTLEICKDVGHFSGEVWLSGDIQAGWSFQNKLGSGRAALCGWNAAVGKSL